jgi:hypothetical protein
MLPDPILPIPSGQGDNKKWREGIYFLVFFKAVAAIKPQYITLYQLWRKKTTTT